MICCVDSTWLTFCVLPCGLFLNSLRWLHGTITPYRHKFYTLLKINSHGLNFCVMQEDTSREILRASLRCNVSVSLTCSPEKISIWRVFWHILLMAQSCSVRIRVISQDGTTARHVLDHLSVNSNKLMCKVTQKPLRGCDRFDSFTTRKNEETLTFWNHVNTHPLFPL